jgi:hypothetical protein
MYTLCGLHFIGAGVSNMEIESLKRRGNIVPKRNEITILPIFLKEPAPHPLRFI